MEILFTQEKIDARIRELGKEISAFYRDRKPTVVIVATGGVIFGADLVRALEIPVRIDMLAVASYDHHSTTGTLRFRSELKLDPAGCDILLVDEVYDSGGTLDALRKYMLDRKAASVAAAAMVVKDVPRPRPETIEFVGFHAPDRYLVGYGMDSDEEMRQLSWIAAID